MLLEKQFDIKLEKKIYDNWEEFGSFKPKKKS